MFPFHLYPSHFIYLYIFQPEFAASESACGFMLGMNFGWILSIANPSQHVKTILATCMNVNTEHSVLHSPDSHTCLHCLEFIIFCILLGYISKNHGKTHFYQYTLQEEARDEKKAPSHMKKDLESRIKTDGINQVLL